ncbi:MAG TPA: YciI family protein [Jatrophihabitantaceae bacterium]|nr:YciI family protein [Jatrophihabitantaceae bacterium]
MKFAILIYHNPQSREIWDRLTPEQRAEGLRGYAGLDDELAASGEMIVSQALADPSHGTRVSVSSSQVVTSDGPFAEAKEHLAGFYLVDCDGIERAVTLAARIPEAAHGLVEVRPTLSLSDFGDLET